MALNLVKIEDDIAYIIGDAIKTKRVMTYLEPILKDCDRHKRVADSASYEAEARWLSDGWKEPVEMGQL